VLDLGAGTGRNTRVFAGSASEVVAADVSSEMLKVLSESTSFELLERIHQVRCDALHLPFAVSCFERVAFVAAIHHIAGAGNRAAAMREIERVTAPGGVVLVTAWALSPRGEDAGKVEKMAGGEDGDYIIRWGTVPRFYHLFTLEELVETVQSAGLVILRSYKESISRKAAAENWVVVASCIKNS